MNFVREYENSIRHMIIFSNRQKLFIFRALKKIFIKKFISSTTSKLIVEFLFLNVFFWSSFRREISSKIRFDFLQISRRSNLSKILSQTFCRSSKIFFANFLTSTFVDVIFVLTFSSKALILRRFAKLTKKKWKYYMKIITKTCLIYFYWDKLLRY